MRIASSPGQNKPVKRHIKTPSEDEMDAFFAEINKAQKKPAILKIEEPYAHQHFLPKLSDNKLPKPISELYDPEALKFDYLTLLDLCHEKSQSLKVTACHVCK